MEIWKNIPFYPFYEISNNGNVRVIEHTDCLNRLKKTRLRKIRKTEKGYSYVTIYDVVNKKYKLMLIHRLVAEAFIPNPNNLPLINHKDCNPDNNNVCNLEWCDYSYNNTYADAIAKRNATRLRNNPNNECWKNVPWRKDVLQYDKNGVFIAEYKSIAEAARANQGFKKTTIGMALNGKSKTAYGYVWKFKPI